MPISIWEKKSRKRSRASCQIKNEVIHFILKRNSVHIRCRCKELHYFAISSIICKNNHL